MKTLLSVSAMTMLLVAGTANAADGKSGRDYFRMIDTNNDGAITLKEYMAFSQLKFTNADTNRDNVVVYEEMVAEELKTQKGYKGAQ